MQKYLRNALVFLLIIFALLGILGQITNAAKALKSTNWAFLGMACVFFIISILIWLISWAYLIKKRSGVGVKNSLFVGFAAVYAALTPIQLGAEALRVLLLKQFFKVPYKDSVAASMVVKGAKFLIIAIFSIAIIALFLLGAKVDFLLLVGIFSGFAVVLLAALLFLLPLKKSFGLNIAAFFRKLSRFIKPAAKLQIFFESYSIYLSTLGKKSFFFVAFLALVSLFFEFLALVFSFLSLSIDVPIVSIAFLFVLISILERTPFLPRGIGLVEGIGFAFLSMPFVSAKSISTESIWALLILFDFVRLVVPSVLSILFYLFFVSKKSAK